MRVAVLSDIHANIVALDAVLGSLGSVDAVWHLGDVVGYGPEPDGVVERLEAVGAVGVRGNHDAAAVGALDLDWFNADARAAIEWTRRRITATTRRWLADLPVEQVEQGFAMVHGSYRDPTWEYVTHAPVARASLTILAEREVSHGLFGHTHLASVFRDDDGRVESIRPSDGSTLRLDGRRALINPGSVGQPRDGRPEAGCMVLDTDAGVSTWHRVAYDVPAVQMAMRAARLPERLAVRLTFGQ